MTKIKIGRTPRHPGGPTGATRMSDHAKSTFDKIEKLSGIARTAWFSLLAYLVFISITLLGVQDADFFVQDRQTQLPIIGVPIPTADFFVWAPILGAALYAYLHVYLLKLWQEIAEARELVELDMFSDKIASSLLNDLALFGRDGTARDTRKYTGAPPPLMWLSCLFTFLLAFVFGPVVFIAFWVRYWPAHESNYAIVISVVAVVATYVGLRSLISLAALYYSKQAPSERWHPGFDLLVIVILCVPMWYVTLAKTQGPSETKGIMAATQNASLLGGFQLLMNIVDPEKLGLSLAAANLRQQELVRKTGDWIEYERHQRQFRAVWCARKGLEPDVCGPVPSPPPDLQSQEPSADNVSPSETARLRYCEKYHIAPGESCKDHFRKLDKEFFQHWLDERKAAIAALPPLDLTNKDLRDADLSFAFLPGADLDGADLRGAGLEGAMLQRAKLFNITFSKDANLTSADLRYADLRKATLESVTLSFARLSGADLTSAELNGARLNSTDLRRSILDDAKLNIDSENERKAILENANLIDATLVQAQLKHANLRQANLSGANLSSAKLHSANMTGATLKSAILTKATLEDTNLRGANLEDADLKGATLKRADLSEANLSGANLSSATLGSADMTGATLKSAILTGATLEDTNLRGANLEDADLERATLKRVDLVDADLKSAILTGATLEDTNLRGANLEDADLERATLKGVRDLREVNLHGAVWTKAILGFIIAHGADFSDATNLTQDQLALVIGDNTTTLPDGLHVWSCLPNDTPPDGFSELVDQIAARETRFPDITQDDGESAEAFSKRWEKEKQKILETNKMELKGQWLCSNPTPVRQSARPDPSQRSPGGE